MCWFLFLMCCINCETSMCQVQHCSVWLSKSRSYFKSEILMDKIHTCISYVEGHPWFCRSRLNSSRHWDSQESLDCFLKIQVKSCNSCMNRFSHCTKTLLHSAYTSGVSLGSGPSPDSRKICWCHSFYHRWKSRCFWTFNPPALDSAFLK